VLGGEEEVVVFVEQGAMEGNQSLPLLVVEFAGGFLLLGRQCLINFDTLALHHDKSGVDALDLGYQLFLGDGPGLGLFEKLLALGIGFDLVVTGFALASLNPLGHFGRLVLGTPKAAAAEIGIPVEFIVIGRASPATFLRAQAPAPGPVASLGVMVVQGHRSGSLVAQGKRTFDALS